MPKFIVVHRKDPNNVGDVASNPLQYFLKPDEYQTIDVVNLKTEIYPSNIPVIVGGGGLIGNDFIGESIRDVLSGADKNQLTHLWQSRWKTSNPANLDLNKEFIIKYQELISEYLNKVNVDRSLKILWGAGHNGEVSKKSKGTFEYPSWLSEFNLLGVRDWNQSHPWAPCASCMHPALRKSYTIKNDVIFFEHKKQLMKDFGNDPIPRFVNSGSNVEQTIELLGSANIILTNSYHGAYWGTLLKKKVIVVGPWSTKFYSLRHMPALLEKDESWKNAVDKAKIYSASLDECASATETFWKNIQARI
jgi:hypothetical protein